MHPDSYLGLAALRSYRRRTDPGQGYGNQVFNRPDRRSSEEILNLSIVSNSQFRPPKFWLPATSFAARGRDDGPTRPTRFAP